jgi:hypothetical protein
MTTKVILGAVLLSSALMVQAQDKKVFDTPKFYGYGMMQYTSNFQSGNKSNSFNLRMIRLNVSGKILGEFEYRLQGQVNGNTSTLGSSPRIVDMYVEWQKYDFFKVKVGQFKRAFTFENPMHPIDEGFMSFSQVISKLSGMTDRTGEHASNGRDIGIQLQGDFLKNATGRNLLHYQVGVYNGQGINTADVDNKKDVIGGLWVMPIKGMRIGAFGWVGSQARNGSYTYCDNEGNKILDATGNTITKTGIVSLNQYRYALSAEYKQKEFQLRAEYIHSTGYGFSTTDQNTSNEKDANINFADGNKADGFYAAAIVPIVPNKLQAKARYDLYRKRADWSTSKTQYEAGVNYFFNKNLQLNAEYAFVNDRANTLKQNYSLLDVQLDVRF